MNSSLNSSLKNKELEIKMLSPNCFFARSFGPTDFYCHKVAHLYLFRNGSGKVVIGDRVEEIKPGSWMIVPANRTHQIIPIDYVEWYVISQLPLPKS